MASSRGVGTLSRSVIAVAGRDQRVVGRLDRRVPAGRIAAVISRCQNSLPEPALEVVAGLDADRRRVQPDEQQAVAQGRQVGEGLDGCAVDHDRRPVRARARAARGRALDVVGRDAGRVVGRVADAGWSAPRRSGAAESSSVAWISPALGRLGLRPRVTPRPSACADLRQGLRAAPDQDGDEHDDEDDEQVRSHGRMVLASAVGRRATGMTSRSAGAAGRERRRPCCRRGRGRGRPP